MTWPPGHVERAGTGEPSQGRRCGKRALTDDVLNRDHLRNETGGFATLAVSIGVMSNALGGSIESHIVAQ
jgi:hypothetical protein